MRERLGRIFLLNLDVDQQLEMHQSDVCQNTRNHLLRRTVANVLGPACVETLPDDSELLAEVSRWLFEVPSGSLSATETSDEICPLGG